MIYIYQLLLKVLSKEQRLPLTLSDEKHTGKVNIMKVKKVSSTLDHLGVLTYEPTDGLADFSDELTEEDAAQLVEDLKYAMNQACSSFFTAFNSAIMELNRRRELKLRRERSEADATQDAPSEVDAPQQPHDDDIQNPGE